MYMMYVDESGDAGLHNSPTQYFVLSGLVLHELSWQKALDELIDFRKKMQATFGLRIREEIHASAMINKPGDLMRIKRHNRLTILRLLADELASKSYFSCINIVVDKQDKAQGYDPFVTAWKVLFQRFENTIRHQNFPEPRNSKETGIIFPDHTDNKKLTQLLRQMRRYNPVPNQPMFGLGYRNLQLTHIVEDPNYRDSAHSYFIQAVDLIAYLLYQSLAPNSYMRRKSGQNYFDRLDPILCKVASRNDPRGIVWL